MTDAILFVDDEPNVLSSIRRSLHKTFSVETAESGEAALEMMSANGGYAVIVSDMRMPGMSGIEFLARARELAPDSVRLMLTGNADQQTAVDAVNVGDVFRFLNKPCRPDSLVNAVGSALRQYQLVTAEKELLEQTLRGSIKAMSDILSLSNPEIFGRATRLKAHVTRVAARMDLPDAWMYESAALLSQIGCTAIAEDLVRRRVSGRRLDKNDMADFADHARVGADLIAAIPRLGDVAECIRYQEKNFDGSGFPSDQTRGHAIPLGARLLKIALDFDAVTASGASDADAMVWLRKHLSFYDPDLLSGFEVSLKSDGQQSVVTMDINALTDVMVLAEDVRTADDVLLVAKGQETTLSVRRRLQIFHENDAIPGRVQVIAKAEAAVPSDG